MREIKFRAWNDVAKVMHESNIPGLLIHFDGELNGLDENGMLEGTENTSQLQLMQYTGLKDCNGVEIFEGDILTDHGDEGPLYIEYSTVHAAFVFVDKFDPLGTTLYTTTCISYGGFEIIGNIYENPELLEESQNGTK